MATIATTQLGKTNFKVDEWIIKYVARSYGLFAHLDVEKELTEKELIESLKQKFKKPEAPIKLTEVQIIQKYEDRQLKLSTEIMDTRQKQLHLELATYKVKCMLKNYPKPLLKKILTSALNMLDLSTEEYDTTFQEELLKTSYEDFKQDYEKTYQAKYERYENELDNYNNLALAEKTEMEQLYLSLITEIKQSLEKVEMELKGD